MQITTDQVIKLLEETKDELIIEIPDNAPTLAHMADHAVNHGIYQMFITAIKKILEMEG